MAPDQRAAGELLERIRRTYGGWIRSRVRSRFARGWEDIEQDVMLKLGQGLPRMRETGERSLRALISRTLRSVFVDELRKRSRREEPGAAPEEPPDPAPGVSETVATRESVGLLKSAGWARLTRTQRRILKLRFEQGLSFRQIAEFLDVPQGSVAGWYSRALEALREFLR